MGGVVSRILLVLWVLRLTVVIRQFVQHFARRLLVLGVLDLADEILDVNRLHAVVPLAAAEAPEQEVQPLVSKSIDVITVRVDALCLKARVVVLLAIVVVPWVLIVCTLVISQVAPDSQEVSHLAVSKQKEQERDRYQLQEEAARPLAEDPRVGVVIVVDDVAEEHDDDEGQVDHEVDEFVG